MIKNTFVLLLATTLFLMGCKKDDDSSTDKDLTFPLTTVFSGVVKGDIEVWTKTNGQLVSIALSDTDLDEDDLFTTDVGSEGTYNSVVFKSETEADLIGEGDLVLPDTNTVNYTCTDNELTFPIVFGSVTFTIKATGTPTSFEIASQAYIEDDGDGFTYSSYGAIVEDIESLKSQLEEGSTMAVMNYTEKFAQ